MKNTLTRLTGRLAAALLVTAIASCAAPSYPPGHPWWTHEPVDHPDGSVAYMEEQGDACSLVEGQGDGPEPGETDGTCPAAGRR